MNRFVAIRALPLLLVAALWGCSGNQTTEPKDDGAAMNTVTCLGCHSSEAALKMSLAMAPVSSAPAIPAVLADDG